jgi:predicted O-methyltransferase YrrM
MFIDRVLKKTYKKLLKSFQSEEFPAGHYYSAIPSIDDIEKYKDVIFDKNDSLKGIELNTEQQLNRLREFFDMHETLPFYNRSTEMRFNIENDSFSYDDAPVLHYMLRHIEPRRIIEIGSGNSSACMLDTCEHYLEGKIDFTFIDINCNNLRKILKPEDIEQVRIIEKPIQEVDLECFESLQENDLLFIDSSHMIKAGSDLNTIYFKILPLLNKGVYIHIHDIRFPFQYFRDTIDRKVYWNEAYLLHAFLQYNNSFEIVFWLNYLLNTKGIDIKNHLECLPLHEWDRRFNNNQHDYSGAGGSIYIRKI